MLRVTDELLSEMARAIVKEVDPESVILFGSRAAGRETNESDVDFIVIERDPFGTSRSRREELLRIRRALSHFHVAKDLLVYSNDEVKKWRGSLNHVLGRALREGKVLYERS